ncbi:hypothetical protein [Bradyrhizobium sp. AUGA SZCCT0182]|uniref:hypothetical protein n=1 Tax=Bradyrhizobium sp. AUGA SZCCT0182 TaxID=2807667 RepID=UPI001BA923B2|nr:hypothetical protein [Bradyrhizobium sp. AUGA SZCCT0182]MBR1232271.1 hypothetical protein [Bradyrhizobium sp. AUGA SZCCT0182]
MTKVAQIYEHRFPNADLPIMRFQVGVFEIAQLLGFRVENWMEEGLGQAHGMFLRLPSGRVILFRELQHLIEHHHAKGPTVYVDAGSVAEFGVEPLIGEVLTALDASPQAVDWVASSESREIAIDLVKRVAAYNRQNE